MCKRTMYVIVTFLVLIGFMGSTAMCQPAAKPSPIGWWKFDDGAGTTAADSSGDGYDGVVQNGSDSVWAEGRFGGSVNLGNNVYVTVSPEIWGKVSTQFTITFWAFGTEGMPNNYGFYAGNASTRLVACHLPWDGVVYYDTTSSWERISKAATPSQLAGQWHHWTFTRNADTGDKKIYLDGELWHRGTGVSGPITGVTGFAIGAETSGWGPFLGRYDEFRLYNVELSADQIKDVMLYVGRELATNPIPRVGDDDILRDSFLSWVSGPYAATHDVYFGTVFDDVNDASRANPMGVLVSQGQEASTYDPPGRLDFDEVYYWRIDEVNAAPDQTIFKGDVWSFKAEAYAISVTNIKATASSQHSADNGPQKTVDGSGLNADDQHSTADADMWLTRMSSPQPTWIRYEFDRPYKLHQMRVWNANQTIEASFGVGAKSVTVEYSLDGNNWTALDPVEFAQAPGTDRYEGDPKLVEFDGGIARHVRLTVNSNWSPFSIPQYGISEVRFLAVPVRARVPDPADGSTGLSPATVLSWRSGREAGTHDVYLGTDPNALALAATVTEPAYQTSLDLDETYYWQVNEVNTVEDPAVWDGSVWGFSTQPYLPLDDFESYTNDSPNRLFQTWVDGLGFSPDDFFPAGREGNGSGAIIGYDPLAGTIVETVRVNSGSQSMPLFYDNSVAGYSEAQYTFAEAQDWTQHGVKTLSLAFHGDPNNTGQMYVKIDNTKVPYNGKAEDIKRTLWQPWNIDLASTGANLTSVTKLAIGVDGAAAAGVLYIDDVRLYARAGELIVPVDPGTTGLAAHYKFDGNLNDSAGTYHGTALGDAQTASDPVKGQVLSLDGIGDAVDVPLIGSMGAITISMWVNSAVDTTDVQFASMFHSNGWEAGDIHWRFGYARVDGGFSGVPNLSGRSRVKPNVWYHVAATVTPTEWALWLDGLRDGVASVATPAAITLGDGLIGAWLGTDGVTISRGFTGKIDDVRFYNRALSQEELAWLAGRTEPFAKPFN